MKNGEFGNNEPRRQVSLLRRASGVCRELFRFFSRSFMLAVSLFMVLIQELELMVGSLSTIAASKMADFPSSINVTGSS